MTSKWKPRISKFLHIKTSRFASCCQINSQSKIFTIILLGADQWIPPIVLHVGCTVCSALWPGIGTALVCSSLVHVTRSLLTYAAVAWSPHVTLQTCLWVMLVPMKQMHPHFSCPCYRLLSTLSLGFCNIRTCEIQSHTSCQQKNMRYTVVDKMAVVWSSPGQPRIVLGFSLNWRRKA